MLSVIKPHLSDDGFITFKDNNIKVCSGWHEAHLVLFAKHSQFGSAGAVGHWIVDHLESREVLPRSFVEPACNDALTG